MNVRNTPWTFLMTTLCLVALSLGFRLGNQNKEISKIGHPISRRSDGKPLRSDVPVEEDYEEVPHRSDVPVEEDDEENDEEVPHRSDVPVEGDDEEKDEEVPHRSDVPVEEEEVEEKEVEEEAEENFPFHEIDQKGFSENIFEENLWDFSPMKRHTKKEEKIKYYYII